jgi:putative transposase
VQQLKYKAVWHNRQVIEIDRWFPSSKTCSCCGHILPTLDLNVREWVCPKCGEAHDRDTNAARNILAEGLRLISGSGIESDTKQKPMEALPKLGESMKSETSNFDVIHILL